MKTDQELAEEMVKEFNEGFGSLQEEIELVKKTIRARDAEWVESSVDMVNVKSLDIAVDCAVKEALRQARAEYEVEKDICKTCGFSKSAERNPVILTNDIFSLIHYEVNLCEECGHQADGSTLKPVASLVKRIVERKNTEIEDAVVKARADWIKEMPQSFQKAHFDGYNLGKQEARADWEEEHDWKHYGHKFDKRCEHCQTGFKEGIAERNAEILKAIEEMQKETSNVKNTNSRQARRNVLMLVRQKLNLELIK
jgi:hypothetical protein